MLLPRLRTVLASLRYRELYRLPVPLRRSMLDALQILRPVSKSGRIFLHHYAPPIGGESYRQYLRGLQRMAAGERVPLVAHLSVTDNCPYRCARCSNYPTGHEPSTQELLRDIQTLKQAGCCLLAFTGGEPLLRSDLPELIAACQPQIATLLYSTGYGLDHDRAARLHMEGLDMAYFSLDHSKPSLHDAIRMRTGAHASAVAAIGHALAAGIFTGVQTVVEAELLPTAQMQAHLDYMQSLGVDDIVLLEPVDIWARGDTTPARRENIHQTTLQWHDHSLGNHRLPKITAAAKLEGKEAFGCQGGFSFIYINTAGDIFPCDFVPRSFGNIRKDGLSVVLERLQRCIVSPGEGCPAGCGSATESLPQAWPASGDWAQAMTAGRVPSLMNWLTRYNLPVVARDKKQG